MVRKNSFPETLTELLFDDLSEAQQNLIIIENGVGSISKKCQQLTTNANYLCSELQGELYLFNKRSEKEKNIRKINVMRGIACWNKYESDFFTQTNNYSLQFGILLREAPLLTTSTNKKLYESIKLLVKKIKPTEHEEKYILEAFRETKNIANLEQVYKFIKTGRIGTMKLSDGLLQGLIAESYMSQYIQNTIQQTNKKIRLTQNLFTPQKKKFIGHSRTHYGVETEIDFILTSPENIKLKEFNAYNQNNIHVLRGGARAETLGRL